MKTIFPESHPEKKAKTLWRSFDRRNQAAFWQQYEQLIQTGQSVTQVSPIQDSATVQKPPKSLVINGPESFRPAFYAYLGTVFLIVVFAVMALYLINLILKSEIPLMESEGSLGSAMMIVVLLAGWLTYGYQFNIFKIDDTYFYVYRPLLFFYTRHHWADIQSIILEGENGHSRSLTVLTNDLRSLSRYRYQLSPKTQKRLLIYLQQQVPDVRDRIRRKW